MNEVARAKRELGRVGLMSRLALWGMPRLIENPTDEIDDHIKRTGRMPKLHGMADDGSGAVLGRVEENYLYSTRRFPLDTADNTIGAGAVAAGDYNFFTSGVGDAGSQMGYFSISNLTYVQTNMAPSGKIPTGRGFKMYDLAVSFNSLAVAADIGQLLDSCSLRFEKQAGQLVVQHGPIILWPGGVGMSGYAATTVAATSLQASTSGVPNLAAVRRYRNPRILSANEDFKYIVNAAAKLPNVNSTIALGAFVEMRIWLYGYVLDQIPN
jgi:hypothetical protein